METRCRLIFILGWLDSPSTRSGSVEEVFLIRSHYHFIMMMMMIDDDDDDDDDVDWE